MAVVLRVDDAHFLHQSVAGEVGPTLLDFGSMERKILKTPPTLLLKAIPGLDSLNLPPAKNALAVVKQRARILR